MTTLKHSRQLRAVMQPLTGDRSAGSIRMVSIDPSVPVPKNTYLLPIVTSAAGNSQIIPDMTFRTDADATVTPAGVTVPITSVLGGASYNLPANTQYRIDPEIDGIVPVCNTVAAPTGGADVTGRAAVKRVVWFEEMQSSKVSTDLFLAKVGDFPAIVLVWESTAEGICYGPNIYLRPDRWSMHIVVSRQDYGEARAADGTLIMDAVEDILTSRAHVDGEPFSSKFATLHSRARLAVTDASYVYTVQFSTFHAARQTETRPSANFPLWVKTKYNLVTTPPSGTLNPSSLEIIKDATYNQAQPPPPFP